VLFLRCPIYAANNFLLHNPYFQAAKEGCLNIVRQAANAGIKQIVVISSVAALAVLVPGITLKAPLTSNGMYLARMQRCLGRIHRARWFFVQTLF